MTRKEAYKILGVESGCSSDELKRAYRKKAMMYHPDRGGDEEMFKQVNNAYHLLTTNKQGTYQGGGVKGSGLTPEQREILRDLAYVVGVMIAQHYLGTRMRRKVFAKDKKPSIFVRVINHLFK